MLKPALLTVNLKLCFTIWHNKYESYDLRKQLMNIFTYSMQANAWTPLQSHLLSSLLIKKAQECYKVQYLRHSLLFISKTNEECEAGDIKWDETMENVQTIQLFITSLIRNLLKILTNLIILRQMKIKIEQEKNLSSF